MMVMIWLNADMFTHASAATATERTAHARKTGEGCKVRPIQGRSLGSSGPLPGGKRQAQEKRFRADAPNQNTRFQDPDLRAQNDPESATVCRKMG